VEWTGDSTCWTGDRGQEADASWTPEGLVIGGEVGEAAGGCPFPNVVLEVAYKNESLASLRAKLNRWVGPETSVQVAIGIKINAVGSRHVAILHQRDQDVQVVEFGVDAPPPPVTTLSFPLVAVYVGVDPPAALAGLDNPQISIDLVALRTVIDTAVQREVVTHAARAPRAPRAARAATEAATE
jgi:hypothetical protein